MVASLSEKSRIEGRRRKKRTQLCEREALSTIALHGLRFCADTLPCRLEAHVDVLLETLKTIASEDTALTTRCALAVPTIAKASAPTPKSDTAMKNDNNHLTGNKALKR